jgi:toxin ParE1/3/4
MQLVWTPRALKDRQKAIDHIAQHNPVAALNQLDEIEAQTDLLPDNPEIGRPGRRQETKELVISRTHFVVVYRIKRKGKVERIEILRVLHTSQAWPIAKEKQ